MDVGREKYPFSEGDEQCSSCVSVFFWRITEAKALALAFWLKLMLFLRRSFLFISGE